MTEILRNGLPFGQVTAEDAADVPNNPLVYAERKFTGGYLMWNGDTMYDDRDFVLVFSPPELSRKELISVELHSREVSRTQAEKILEQFNGFWSYAE